MFFKLINYGNLKLNIMTEQELKKRNICTNNEKDYELNICKRCENLYCEDCSSTYNQFSQIDYNCCSTCAETRIED